MGKVVRFPIRLPPSQLRSYGGQVAKASAFPRIKVRGTADKTEDTPTIAAMTAQLAKIAAEIAAEASSQQAQVLPRASTTPGFLKGERIHRTIRGDRVRSKSELAIADILYGFERQGRLHYFYEERLPFAKNPERWCDFLIQARGAYWYWEHCGVPEEAYRRRWEQKRIVYEQNGYGVYSASHPEGRLIVTEDGPDHGLDSQAIYRLARELFVG